MVAGVAATADKFAQWFSFVVTQSAGLTVGGGLEIKVYNALRRGLCVQRSNEGFRCTRTGETAAWTA